MRSSLTALAAVLLTVAALTISGCGLKGDLYLPGDESASPAPKSDEDTPDEASGGEPES